MKPKTKKLLEDLASMCDIIGGKNSQGGKEYRASIRKAEIRKKERIRNSRGKEQ